MSIRFSDEEFTRLKDLLLIYEWGQKTLLTKLNIMQEDFKNFQDTSPIEYVNGRVKSPESIAKKLHKLGLEITTVNVKKHLKDVAGIRIICSYAKDIPYLVELL